MRSLQRTPRQSPRFRSLLRPNATAMLRGGEQGGMGDGLVPHPVRDMPGWQSLRAHAEGALPLVACSPSRRWATQCSAVLHSSSVLCYIMQSDRIRSDPVWYSETLSYLFASHHITSHGSMWRHITSCLVTHTFTCVQVHIKFYWRLWDNHNTASMRAWSCSPPPDSVFWRLIFPRAFFSGGGFISETLVSSSRVPPTAAAAADDTGRAGRIRRRVQDLRAPLHDLPVSRQSQMEPCAYTWCIPMHVGIYACSHVCMHVCMYVCIYACMHACMYACTHVCMYACM